MAQTNENINLDKETLDDVENLVENVESNTETTNAGTTSETNVTTTTGTSTNDNTQTMVDDVDVDANVSGTGGITADLTTAIVVDPSDPNNSEDYKKIVALSEQIKCADFKGLGTMDEYMNLFKKTKEFIDEYGGDNVDLEIDISKLTEFADYAEQFSLVFTDVTQKFQKLSQVDASVFLKGVQEQLTKIVKLVGAVKNFKTTIVGTSVLTIPSTINATKVQIDKVLSEMNCVINHMEVFSGINKNPIEGLLNSSKLSDADRLAIAKAEAAIDSWKEMIVNGASVKMAQHQSIIDLKAALDAISSDRLKACMKEVADRLTAWKAGNYI